MLTCGKGHAISNYGKMASAAFGTYSAMSAIQSKASAPPLTLSFTLIPWDRRRKARPRKGRRRRRRMSKTRCSRRCLANPTRDIWVDWRSVPLVVYSCWKRRNGASP